jgi:hypothetical protein
MDWKNKTWEKEDLIYAQKRKVTNKGSDKWPHFIGSFPSRKNPNSKWITQWESLNERLFFYLLELDPLTIRYYVQPVQVQVPFLKKDGKKGTWVHTSDVLFYRQGSLPYLCQVKESPTDIDKKAELCNKYSRMYAVQQGLEYAIVYPKLMPKVIKKNLEFLMGCVKERQGYKEWIELLMGRIKDLGKVSIENVSISFQYKGNPFFINTVIYHLIANGLLLTDILQPLTQESLVWVASDLRYTNDYFAREGRFLELCSTQSKLQILSIR